MLENILKQCPDELWFNTDESESIWKRFLHVLESIDYWFDDFDDYKFINFFGNLSAEMEIKNSSCLSKNEISKYLKVIKLKSDDYFKHLNPLMLTDKSIKHPKVTYLDIILSQIRHIQVNIGYCNEKFNHKGIQSIEWIGYNEEN